MNRTALACTSVASLALFGSIALLAGPLDPPPGAVVSSYKTLTEVEPRVVINAANTPGDADSLFKITQPGSYYLTGNITGAAAKHGIEIAANDVTLDLTGFALTGVGASLGGITVTASVTNLTIRDGTIRGWGQAGIGSTNAKSCILDNLQASNNAISGILAGENATVRACTARQNTGIGISAQGGSTITGCTASGNTTTGIAGSGFGCTIADCAAGSNGGIGIRANVNSAIRGCTSRENGGHGIEAGANCVIEGSTSEANTGSATGIVAGAGCSLTGCTASGNAGDGFDADEGSNLVTCSAHQNGNRGIVAGFGCKVSNCSASVNTGTGIAVGSGGTATDCVSRSNSNDGISCASFCVIRGNTCHGNGAGAGSGAGIHAGGSNNRVEGNNCTSADVGILVTTAGNFIVRNTCRSNANNWSLVTGNAVLIVNANLAGSVFGNSGGVSPGSIDPNANFSY